MLPCMEAWLRLLIEVLIFFFCYFLLTFLKSLTFSSRDFVHAMVVLASSFFTIRLFGWLLRVARLHEPGRQEPGSRDATNFLVLAEPGPGCFKYRASLAPHLHAGNQTHTSHA
jgi:hypothetical protein